MKLHVTQSGKRSIMRATGNAGEPPLNDDTAPATLTELVRLRAKQRGTRLAYHGALDTWTYADLDRASNCVAHALLAEGIVPGRRVAALTRHAAQCMVLVLGAAKVGAVCMPINWRLTPAELDVILKNGDARFLLVDSEFAPLLPRLARVDKMVTVITDRPVGKRPAFASWYERCATSDPGVVAAPGDTALQVYSSGTTGLPKGVELTHRNLLASVRSFGQRFGYREDDALPPDSQPILTQPILLNALPTFHVAGLGAALLTLDAGGRSLMHPGFVPADMLNAIESERVSHLFMVPAMIQALLAQPDIERRDLSSLRCIAYGASPINDRLLIAAMKTFDCDFLQVYGLTETAGTVTSLGPEDHDPHGPRKALLRSAGRATPEVGLRVVDPLTGIDRSPGEVGEIWIRSQQNMKGYWRNPQATADAFPQGRRNGQGQGWFRTGDAGYLKDDYLFIHDRIKDMIMTGGEHVYPAEVENLMMQHPAVADGAIIGVPDEHWGEAVKACVVLRPGMQLDPDDLITFLRARLAPFKCPKSVDVLTELPRNPSGKLLKYLLRKPFWEGRER